MIDQPPTPGEVLALRETILGKERHGFIWESGKHPGYFHVWSWEILDDGDGLSTATRRPFRWSAEVVDVAMRHAGFETPTVNRVATDTGDLDRWADLTPRQPAAVPKTRKKAASKPAVGKVKAPRAKR